MTSNFNRETVFVFPQRSNGRFDVEPMTLGEFGAYNSPLGLTVADMDGDHEPDIVVEFQAPGGTVSEDAVRIFFNAHRP